MKHDLLIEIGFEELPASFLEPAAIFFKNRVFDFLTKAGVDAGLSKIFYTPRRIALLITQVALKQSDQTQEIQGPPKSLAYDKNNQPTQAALGFARTHTRRPADLYTKVTPKGEYIFLKKESKGKGTTQLLSEFLPDAILSLPFPKTMRWTEAKTRFGRPIRWLVALLGETPIKFEINGVKSGAYTYGHRMANPKPIRIKSPNEYERVLKMNYVIPDFEERKKIIQQNLQKIAGSFNAHIVEDQELLTEAINVVEYPNPLLCQFNSEFLPPKLPPIVVITALKAHQRCFSLTGTSGAPLASFIAITNIPKKKSPDVKIWIERMVGSRLADAKFYWDEDLKIGLEPLVDQEKRVTWIAGLGTLYDKTQRIKSLATIIFEALNLDSVGFTSVDLLRAAELSKADLLTTMVREKEFTDLQGIIGSEYARMSGERERVVIAIREQYETKSDVFGAILSIADKLDNIAASFIVGEIPTGSEDPFALRRQANAIITILDTKFMSLQSHPQKGWLRLPLDTLIDSGLQQYKNLKETGKTTTSALKEFFKERIRTYLIDNKGIRYDVVDAVTDFSIHDIVDCKNRAQACMQFRDRADFEDLVIGQKRVANILRGLPAPPPVDECQLIEPEERTLFEKAKLTEPFLAEALNAENYIQSLELLRSLRAEIDALFDKVLVMAEDQNLRTNRLGLLHYIKSLFLKVADLSKIVLEGDPQ